MFEFVVRMAVFAVGFYYMAEFALLSKVDTSIGVGVIAAIVVSILMYTVVYRAKFVTECEICTRRLVK